MKSCSWYIIHLLSLVTVCCGVDKLHITDNGYKNIIVVVGDDVTEDVSLISKIKEVFDQTSRILYHLTRLFVF